LPDSIFRQRLAAFEKIKNRLMNIEKALEMKFPSKLALLCWLGAITSADELLISHNHK
jgi:hypothetical protein